MGSKLGKVTWGSNHEIRCVDNRHHFPDDKNSTEGFSNVKENIRLSDTALADLQVASDNIGFQVADPKAFHTSLVQRRQQAIDNRAYRRTIKSWQPDSLQQLAEINKIYSEGKSSIDRYWIIFYWITYNIEYDIVSYFSKDYKDQTAEGVFRNRKGVCAGYGNLYKYLCDELQIAM